MEMISKGDGLIDRIILLAYSGDLNPELDV